MNQAKAPTHHGVITSGWAITVSSNVRAADILAHGFRIEDNRLYPNSMEDITSRLGPLFEVTEVTMPGTTSLRGLPSRSVHVKRLIAVPATLAPMLVHGTAHAASETTVPADVIGALQRFARAEGRTWKSRLLKLWENGRDEQHADGPLLRQMRNNFGPKFLIKMRLPVPSAG